MPTKPCSCPDGHRYSRSRAEELGFVCDKDGLAITCVAKKSTDSPTKPKTGEKDESRGPR